MMFMPQLKHDFELRRVIFGLSCVVNTPPQNLPALVAERLPDIVKSLAMLSMKMRQQRLDVLKDNEEHLKDELKRL